MASVPSNGALGKRPGLGQTRVLQPGGSAKDRAARAFGARIHPVEAPDPETGDWLTARRALVGRLVDELGGFNLDQYSNRAAFRAHREGTMREIVEQLGHAPDILVVAVNTTGTIGGCARHIRDNGLPTRAIAVDAEGSVLFGGTRGERILPGYGAGVVTELSRETVPDEVIRVNARDAVAAARHCARLTGFLPSASGGAVCVGVEKLARENEGRRSWRRETLSRSRTPLGTSCTSWRARRTRSRWRRTWCGPRGAWTTSTFADARWRPSARPELG